DALRRAPRRSRDRLDPRARSTPPRAPPDARGEVPWRADRARERLPQPEAQRDDAKEGTPRRVAQPALARARVRFPDRAAGSFGEMEGARGDRGGRPRKRDPRARMERRRRRLPDDGRLVRARRRRAESALDELRLTSAASRAPRSRR